MTQKRLLLGAALVLGIGSAIVAAQTQTPATPVVPSAPTRQFGASINPAFEGWFDNPDGTHSFLIGYYNRNTSAEIDIPIGPNNKFEGPNPDMGQPTHFLTRRHFGVFIVTVPKDFPKTEKIRWTLTANGTTTTVPFYMHTDYNLTPLKSQEESPNREFNTPPALKFTEAGPAVRGPLTNGLKPTLTRTATVGTPMPIDIWADDDALFSSGGNGPMSESRPIIVLDVTKYRGPGTMTVSQNPVKFTALKGGKPLQPYSGKGTTTVSFSEPGDYLLHINGGDYSGNGGGGSGCCWTTAIMKVSVAGATRTGGQ